MKLTNILCIKEEPIQCEHGCKGFFCETPVGGDYTTCPFCDKMIEDWWDCSYDFSDSEDENESKQMICDNKLHFNKRPEGINRNNSIRDYTYCDDCKILWTTGCVHQINGCSDDKYNAHFISKWCVIGHPTHNPNIIYEGMPIFNDTDDFLKYANHIKVIQEACFTTDRICISGAYPILKNKDHWQPQRRKCELRPLDDPNGEEAIKRTIEYNKNNTRT